MNKVPKRVLIVLISISMFVNTLPIVHADDVVYKWYNYIDKMLEKEYVEGEVVVAVDNSKKSLTFNRLIGGKELTDDGEEIAEVDSDSVAVPTNSNDISIEIIKRSDLTTKQILNKLKNDKSVLFAEPNYVTSVSNTDNKSDNKTVSSKNNPSQTSDLTNLQWGFDPNETYSMKIPNWNTAGGNMNKEIIVAVIDTGIDTEHEDLKNKIYSISEDLQQKTGCGEKRCNFVDDDVMNIHGTHVAGIIGAEWNNIGISGAASNVKMIDIRIGNRDGNISLESTIRAYTTVKIMLQNGVDIKIINNSWGGLGNTLSLQSLLKEVSDLGAVSVIAAGNENANLDKNIYIPTLPARNTASIVVASNDINGKKSSFSNYGSGSVDLYAPGRDIYSTVITNSLSKKNPTKDLLYTDDFETNKVATIYQDENELTTTLTNEYKSHGSKSLKIDLSSATYDDLEAPSKTFTYYDVNIKFGDVNLDNKPVSGQTVLSIDINKNKFAAITGRDYNYSLEVKNKNNEFVLAENISSDEILNKTWNSNKYILPEDTDYDDLEFRVRLIFDEAVDYAYIDNLNIYSPNIVSYDYMNGTSMATPAVSGALAVLLGNLNTGISAEDAKALLLSYVKPISTLGNTKTNGILDLTIANSIDFSPVIKNIDYSDKKITINGSNFSDTQGTVTVSNLKVYGDGEDAIPSDISWSDKKIELIFSDFVRGLYSVTVTTTNGKSVLENILTDKTNTVFENDLSFFEDYGAPFEFDSNQDFYPSGYMEAYKNYLYYMPMFDEYMRPLYRYDINNNKWKKMTPLPDNVYCTRGAIIDGKIIIVGTKNDKAVAYAYDIATDFWKELNSNYLPKYSTVVNYDGQLLLISGNIDNAATKKIYVYDYKNSNIYYYAELDSATKYAYAYASNDALYVINPSDKKFQKVTGTRTEVLTTVYSKVTPSNIDYSFTIIDDGLLMHAEINKIAHTDLYLLKNDETEFEPYNKRISDDMLFQSALASYNGKVYAISRGQNEKNITFFRSSYIDTLSVDEEDIKYKIIRGDNSIYNKKDLTIIANGDIDKLKAILINNVELDSKNYTLSEGSTVLTLKKEYLDTLKDDIYALTFVYGDGMIETNFTVACNNANTSDDNQKNKEENQPVNNKPAERDVKPTTNKPTDSKTNKEEEPPKDDNPSQDGYINNYKILSISSKTVEKGKSLIVRADGKLSDLLRLELNGKLLKSEYYTLSEGSTIAELHADYLETLAAGDYTLTFVYKDGTVDAKFKLSNAKDDSKNPKTGDNINNQILFLELSVMGLISLIIYIKIKKGLLEIEEN